MALAEKFGPPRSPLQLEDGVRALLPQESDRQAFAKRFVTEQLRHADSDPERSAWYFWLTEIQRKEALAEYDHRFFVEFVAWLLGTGRDVDHDATPWKKQPVTHNPSVLAFLRSFTDRQHEFLEALQRMQMRAHGGRMPQDINEYYLYYKYIVRGHWRDQSGQFMSDWNHLMAPDHLYSGNFDREQRSWQDDRAEIERQKHLLDGRGTDEERQAALAAPTPVQRPDARVPAFDEGAGRKEHGQADYTAQAEADVRRLEQDYTDYWLPRFRELREMYARAVQRNNEVVQAPAPQRAREAERMREVVPAAMVDSAGSQVSTEEYPSPAAAASRASSDGTVRYHTPSPPVAASATAEADRPLTLAELETSVSEHESAAKREEAALEQALAAAADVPSVTTYTGEQEPEVAAAGAVQMQEAAAWGAVQVSEAQLRGASMPEQFAAHLASVREMRSAGQLSRAQASAQLKLVAGEMNLAAEQAIAGGDLQEAITLMDAAVTAHEESVDLELAQLQRASRVPDTPVTDEQRYVEAQLTSRLRRLSKIAAASYSPVALRTRAAAAAAARKK